MDSGDVVTGVLEHLRDAVPEVLATLSPSRLFQAPDAAERALFD